MNETVTRQYTVPELVSCAAREVAMRRNVYPRYVASGKIKQESADKEIAMMTQICGALVMGGALAIAAREIIALKKIKRAIEAKTATDEEREFYRSRKEQAWTNLEAALK